MRGRPTRCKAGRAPIWAHTRCRVNSAVSSCRRFFTYSHAEHELIGRRRGPTMKLGLALHIGFLRMSGCLLDAFSILPPVLLRHLGTELGINTPDLASLRALYAARANRSPDHRLLAACQTLGVFSRAAAMNDHRPKAIRSVLTRQ
ncbi:DUF4158 domain-containing protein [Cupriavidus basilensis]